MINDLKNTFQKSTVYAIGNIATKLIGLVLIPLYTDSHYFSVSDFGALGILEITSQIFVAILSLSLSQSLARWYWDADYLDKQKSVFFTTLVVMFGLSLAIISALFPFSLNISNLLFNFSSFEYVIKLVLITSGIQVISNQILTLARLQEKALLYSIYNIIKLLISLVLTIYFVVYQSKKIDGIFEATLIGSVVSFILILPFTLRNCEYKFEGAILKEMLIFGYPLIIASMSGVFFSVIDRYLLNYMRGLDDVGIYNLGYKLSSTLNVVVITSIQLALTPVLMQKMNDPNNKRFYSKVLTYFSFVLMFSIIVLSLFSLEGIKLFVNNVIYWDSVYVVAILSFATMFSIMKDQALIGLQLTKKTKITGSVIVIATIVNILLNMLLIPIWGIYGSAIGMLISQIVFFWIIYYKAQQVYFIPYEMKKIYILLGVGAVLICLGLLLNPINAWVRVPLKLLLIALYFILLNKFKFFDTAEKDAIMKILHAWKNPQVLSQNLKRLFS